MVRNEDKGRQAEVIWTCYEEKSRICRKKGDGNGVIGKQEKRETKKRFLDVVKEDMGKVGAKETDVEDRMVWRLMIRCGYP